jgi:hypothetical protein
VPARHLILAKFVAAHVGQDSFSAGDPGDSLDQLALLSKVGLSATLQKPQSSWQKPDQSD